MANPNRSPTEALAFIQARAQDAMHGLADRSCDRGYLFDVLGEIRDLATETLADEQEARESCPN